MAKAAAVIASIPDVNGGGEEEARVELGELGPGGGVHDFLTIQFF
jgi:hypothetical protein